jgi:DNA invertase Pin-like site-specific DNA recombinase
MSFNNVHINNLNELVISSSEQSEPVENNIQFDFNTLNISNHTSLCTTENCICNDNIQNSSDFLKVNKKENVYAVKKIVKQISKTEYQIQWSDNSISNCNINNISPYTISLYNTMCNHNNSINNPINKKAFIYIRESQKTKSKFTESTSRNTQQQLCLQFCKSNNICVEYVAEDIGVSGRNMKNLETGELSTYVNYINENNIMVLYSIDRLGRHAGKALCFLDNLMKRNIDVYFVKEQKLYNKNIKSIDKLTICNSLSAAESYSNEESEKIKNNIKLRRSQGHYVGSVPYGYKISFINGIRRKVRDTPKIEVVRKILIKYKDELSKNNICNKKIIYITLYEEFKSCDSKLTKNLIKRIIMKRLKNIDYQYIRC